MRRKLQIWVAAALAAALLGSGCAGIISETTYEDGQTDRVRVGTADKWSSWDKNSTKNDDSVIMLKKESTF